MSALHYPEQLPVVGRRDEILDAIRAHQVVVIAGETGSGKTTQLPKMCLELGLGATGQIGHTQPRRIAARSVAERIAEELQVPLGDLVGYQVRFTDASSRSTRVKVMTDGILLNELQRDRDLRRYDTIIVDEAHERSLNIDFILGYLKSLLPRRPDLKVIITSATIDPEKFARHFATNAAGEVVREVPVIEVSGRTYPVEIRYRPLVERAGDGRLVAERDQITGVVEAVEELWTESGPTRSADDVLAFFSGEREIKDARDALESLRLPDTEILPLYARLSTAEQHKVFHRGKRRRIILATNVAETSLTVPGVGFVIDTGVARISRYSQRTKVQRLPIEPISQASAAQRSGRCGRVADGIAIRLWSAEEQLVRAEFTEPEILRTSLAAVILQMTALGLGDIAAFPFLDPPDPRQIADGVRLLEELGAFSTNGQEPGRHRGRGRRLTAFGRTLARLPVDPRLGRMLIEAGRLGCTREVLVLVAAMSIQDPRERPADQQTQADQAHARFRDPDSDFASLYTLWGYLKNQQKALSQSAFRRMCRTEFLHYLRVREWQDLHAQLRSACKAVGIDPDQATAAREATPAWDTIHRALLSGLLSQIGLWEEPKREYLGARGARFAIAPGSTLFRKRPDYVMAAELVETSRLWARRVAPIDPQWAEDAAGHLVRRTVSEPRWSKRLGAAVASERVTLFGVPLAVDRTVQYGPIDAEVARDLFIRHALVEGDWDSHHAFWKHNQRQLRGIEELEERTRRRDLIVDDEVVFTFYDNRIPPDISSERHFDRWWRGERQRRPNLLTFPADLLLSDRAREVETDDYPRVWRQGDLSLAITYQFSPGADADGVSVHIPSAVLNQVQDNGFDWQVPGVREELAVALIRALPKATRRHFVPAPNFAHTALGGVDPDSGQRFVDELARVLLSHTGIRIPAEDWDVSRVPDHLRITFVVEDTRGRAVATGKDLAALRERTGGAVRGAMATAASSVERTGLTAFPAEGVPDTFSGRSGRHDVVGFPALVDEGSTVAVRVLPDVESANAAHRRGLRRLLLLGTQPPWKRVLARLTNAEKLALATAPHGNVPALLNDCLAAAVDDIVAEFVKDPVRTPEAYDAALAAVRTHAAARVLSAVDQVGPVVTAADGIRQRLTAVERGAAGARLAATVADVRAQLDSLIRPGFVADTGLRRLPDLRRYLRAMEVRLDRAPTNKREGELQAQIDAVEADYADLVDSLPAHRRLAADVRDVAWLIEELRVGLFAQSLGTSVPVSVKRVRAALAALQP
ncbi:MAG: ATP-dependent RNA helicase HrpA [Phycicoccus sp.]|nr:ATP-dependent RNA helicase HrpA [Phycicoccus sp.]